MRQTCSIVIRCYNEEKHIGRLLEGILQQTVKDVEVILVDSGSTDATVAIAQSIYPIKLISIKPEEFSFVDH
jgi:glycosyltransferase involved in cell wall biosynthesis